MVVLSIMGLVHNGCNQGWGRKQAHTIGIKRRTVELVYVSHDGTRKQAKAPPLRRRANAGDAHIPQARAARSST